jgi:outer membrane receptor for ferrienterochelin and colicins
MKYSIILFLFSVFFYITSHSQTLKGHVMSADEVGGMTVLPGANIVWLNSTSGTTTKDDGSFILEKTDPSQIQFKVTYVGFETDTITVGDKTSFHIMLDPVKELKQVIIEGESSASSINTVNPVNMESLNKKELLKAACCNLSESFETNNSVDAEFSDAITGAKTIKLLGLDGVYSQIMMENMPGVRGLSSSYGLTYIPGPWIESIQITKGPGSVVNGYESITGSINTEIKKPFHVEGETFLLNLFGSNSGRYEANVNFKHLFNEKWSTALFTHTSQLHNKMDHNEDGFLDMPLNETYIVMNKWNYFSGKKHEAQFGVKYVASDINGGQVKFDPSEEHSVENGYGVGVSTKRFEGFMKNGFVFDKPNTSIGTIVNYVYHDQNAFYGLNNYTGIERYVNANFIYQSFMFNTNNSYKIGASFMVDDYTESFYSINYLRTEYVPGIFAEYHFVSGTKFSLLAGIRVDDHNLYGIFTTPRLHLKYNPTTNTTLRGSVGKGYRVANVFVENSNVLTSSRTLIITEDLLPEEGWNYGVSLMQGFKLNKNEGTFTLDGYRTEFVNQIVVDLDSDYSSVYISNLHGQSYSNVFQGEVNYEVFTNFDMRVAYKYIDAKSTYNGDLLEVPLTNKNRGLVNFAYELKKYGWVFDFTTQFYGKSRLPDLTENHDAHFLGEYSEPYYLLLGQITKKFKNLEIYAGSENITNYTQHHPILGFDEPFGEDFDASVIYAPIMERKFYGGLRWSLY